MTDLKLCFDALEAKQRDHNMRWRYYEGDHPIAFINPKMEQVIPNSVVFKKNWCGVIVDTTRDRLKISSWSHESKTEAERMDDIWQKVLRRCATELHVASLATGEAYLIAWPDADGKPRAYYHDPRQAHMIYDVEYPDIPRVACKHWIGEGERPGHYLNLYYADRIEHYEAPIAPSVYTGYTLAGTDPNPYGAIPVFHFRVNRRKCIGDLTKGILSLQDAMNKLLNDMMVASEFTSFPQRWGIGHWEEDAGGLPVGPGTLVKIPAADANEQPAAVGVFPSGEPRNYLEPIDSLANDMGVLSGTPKHYFIGQGANISGEALQAMEAPLIAKCELYQDVLGDEWRRAMAFCLSIDGAKVDYEDIECIWQPPHTVQPQSQAETRFTNTQAGIPIINILRDEGWNQDQLDQLIEDAGVVLPVAGKTAEQVPTGPQGTPDEQAAMNRVTVDKQMAQVQQALLTALEAVNVDLVDRLTKSGALDRIRGVATPS